VQEEARRLAQQLGQEAGRLAQGRPDNAALLRQMFATIARDDAKALDATWDGAAQCYLALAALHHAISDLDPSWSRPTTKNALRGLGTQLRFPPGLDSPRHYRPADFRRWLQPLQATDAR
jgi:hypothetical protein